ncbi:MAG: group I intron-associated PD-(D/E)XK endonuclease [Candidatus Sulfotelmatobacter sp.]
MAEESDDDRGKRNPKRMGEMSQAAFLVKAQRLGFALAVPWGDSEKCDFIVWEREGGRLLRVQVKATGRLHGGGYDVQPVYSTRGEGKKTYTAAQIDVLAAHVAREGCGGLGEGDAGGDGLCQDERGKSDPEVGEFSQNDVWYLLPVRAIAGVKSLRLFPDLKSKRPRWERYREVWEWMRGKR